jgi:hypothetical protein
LFPAEDPQFVVIVKIDNPRGAFYGGETAAPLLRVMLEQALQARQGSLSRQAAAPAPAVSPRRAPTREIGPAIVLTLPLPDSVETTPADVAIPEVAGTTVRAATLAMHRRGLQVRLRGAGPVTGTRPAAGVMVPAGTIVELLAGRP